MESKRVWWARYPMIIGFAATVGLFWIGFLMGAIAIAEKFING